MGLKIIIIKGSYKTLLFDELSLKFSSKSFLNADDFISEWGKKLTLVTTQEIYYDKIKKIVKEDDEDEIKIRYNNFISVPSELEFEIDKENFEDLKNELKQNFGFHVNEERLSPIKSILPYLFGFVLSIVGTVLMYSVANNPGESIGNGSKKKLLLKLAEFLGPIGVIIVGSIITLAIGWMIFSRYKNPPIRTVINK